MICVRLARVKTDCTAKPPTAAGGSALSGSALNTYHYSKNF